jgi:excisionase family DNA binding protein
MNTVNYEFCTVTLASEWLGVSRQTIYAWVKDGRIAYVPGEKLFYARDLDLIRHERIVEAAKGLEALQDIPTLA